MERILDFIESGTTNGTGVLIHSFEEKQIRLAIAAYSRCLLFIRTLLSQSVGLVMRSRGTTIQSAIEITKAIRGELHMTSARWREVDTLFRDDRRRRTTIH
jgi:hypothetical protein